MAYKVILLAETQEEIIGAALYYKQFSDALSSDIIDRFFEAATLIAENPNLYQTTRKEYRSANMKRFPFKLIYRVKENEIFIVAFSHQKRKPYYWKNR